MPLDKFRKAYQGYTDVYPELSVEQRRIRAVTAEEYWVPSIRLADAHVQGGGEAWMYRLDFTESTGRLQGYAYHGLDVGMVWDKAHGDLGDSIHRAWVAFLRGETPRATGLPAWQAYRADSRSTMILNGKSRMETQPNEPELRLWDH